MVKIKKLKNLKDENLKSFTLHFIYFKQVRICYLEKSKILETNMNLRIKIKLNQQVLTTKIPKHLQKKRRKKTYQSIQSGSVLAFFNLHQSHFLVSENGEKLPK